MNLGLGIFWSVPTLILLLTGSLLLRRSSRWAKWSAYTSFLLGGSLLVGVCLLLLDVFEV
ncbi:hypothetical protein [Ectobacillus ponti]|uniref:Uncharacterized protein n=1 Tax=Ectobacillus ponti TaxID=2961894 RepID=A0AA42BPI1_9BACI|nr:hypothetical protein [Ectobacillus ponti]MCP8968456.1 hypothetical protein [Ectobacillus ponti]